MSGFFARLWQTLGKQRRFVGRDLEGNRFYETTLDAIDSQRPRRTVKYKKRGDLWDTATGISHLPAQWTAWLAHTRTNPPTLDELNNDQARQERLAFNVARLKENEEEEIRRYRQPEAILPPSELDPTPTGVTPESMSHQAHLSKSIGPTAEPQTWAPHSTRRR